MQGREECSVPGCTRRRKARGWCDAHYWRWRHTGDLGSPEIQVIDPSRVCEVEGCEEPYYARGKCRIHYRRWREEDPEAAGVPICSVEGCGRGVNARGLCKHHYLQARNGLLPAGDTPGPPKPQVCAVEGCDKPPRAARGLCWAHYQAQRRAAKRGGSSSE